MRMRPLYAVLAVIVTIALSALPAHAQFDVAGSFYKTFNTSTTGNGTNQTQDASAGFLLEGRYIKSTFLGGEISYGFNPANQSYTVDKGSCGLTCNTQAEAVKAYANEISFNWVVSKQFGRLRPFGVAGLGFVLTVPPGNEYALNTAVKPAYVFGGGVDWGMTKRFGLRAQMRDNVYSAPNATFAFPATRKFMQLAQPAFGVYFRP